MKNIIKSTGIIAVFLIMLFGCSEDFLDRPAQGNLDATTLSNQSGVEGNLIAAYSYLDGQASSGGIVSATSNWVFGSVASDDAYKGSEPGDNQTSTDIEMYQWSASSADGGMNEKWSGHYDAISRVNATINLLLTVEGISQADQDRIRGEALFLRAFYHFELWKTFVNIPYYTEVDVDFRKTNVGVDPLPLILADIDAAINLLPLEQGAVGRVDEWTAKAFKGKVQVYAEDWAGALITLGDVVGAGPYSLEDNYHYVFDALRNNGPETVLAYQASVNDGSSGGQNGNHPDRLNFPHGGSPFGCCGFHQASQNLVNAHKVDVNGLPFLDGTWNDADVVIGDAVDPRLDWTVGRDDVPFLDWGLHAPGWIRDRAWAGPYSVKKTVYEQGAGVASAVGWAPYQMHSMNRHLLRYADVMLLLAEAEIHAGSLDNARDLINEIRTRAAQGAQGPDGGAMVVPIDDASITWATYDIGTYPPAGWDADYAMRALKFERRIELGMEGHRLFDLRRWGDAITVLNDYLAVESTKRAYLGSAFEFEARHMAYPLPTIQIDLSVVDGEQRLVQNPGW
ncbi:MAG: RagB/SusD family nutrient uptake outer membrane protein [Bacteroidetes bacterium]|nr:MAG: RagB/SusD family nutrient uptake outer membrane protein [Bacteroidota bacterium]